MSRKVGQDKGDIWIIGTTFYWAVVRQTSSMQPPFRGSFRWRPSFWWLLRIALALLSPQLALAATRTVTNLNDSGPGSLRDTMATADSGDTINFAVTGTILLTNGQLENGNKNLTIVGPGSPDDLIIQRSSSAVPFRIFYLLDGTVSMSGLTISNGKSTEGNTPRGGGIYSFADLTLNNCVIRDNQTFFAGGGISTHDTLTVVNCSFSRNVVLPNPLYGFDGGGAIHTHSTTVRVSNCTFDDNSGGQQFRKVRDTARFYAGEKFLRRIDLNEQAPGSSSQDLRTTLLP